MIIEILGISVAQGKMQDLGKALASLVGPIQVQPGCLSCRLFQGWGDSEALQMEARWDDQEGLMRHLKSDLYKRLLLLMELSASPPILEFLTVTELRGLDLVQEARPVGIGRK
jgi:quinol monooxygenase YgiN